MDGPQKGWRRRTNPVHTMLDTGTDAVAGVQGFPHGIGGADDVIAMPLQCSTQWDGLGHIFDHGRAWNGRPADQVVTGLGDGVTGHRDGGRRDRRARGAARRRPVSVRRATASCRTASPSPPSTSSRPSTRRAPSSVVGRGDIVVVRTGRLARARRDGLGRLRRRRLARACPSPPPTGCTTPRSRRSPPTPGASRCGPTSSTWPSSHCTRSPSRTSGCSSARCGISTRWPRPAPPTGVYDFFLTAAPLPITGAVGSPVNPIAVR